MELNIDCIVRYPDHPEHLVRIDVHIKIVNLFGKVCRSDRTGEQVKSDKGERALMTATVRPNELTLTKAHVRLVCQRGADARRGVGSGAAAPDVRQSYKPVEIRDLGRIIYVSQRNGGVERIMVNEDGERSKWRDSSRNRARPTLMPVMALMAVIGTGQIWM